MRKKVKDIIEYGIYLKNWIKYKNPAHPTKVIYIKTNDINYFLIGTEQTNNRKDYNFIKKYNGSILKSDLYNFKINAEVHINESYKHIGIRDHYENGTPWIETIFFKENLKKRFLKEPLMKGCSSIEELATYYENYYDKLFINIRDKGIRSSEDDSSIDPILVDIDQDGKFCFTAGGNHRLMMIKVLRIKEIPVRIRSRAEKWQLKRDELYLNGENYFTKKYPSLKGHPDLNDCL